MPDQFSPENQPAVSETDLALVAGEVQRHQERPETRLISGRQLVKHSIQSLSGVQAAPPSASDLSALPQYVQAAPAQTRLEVEHLLSLVFREGILKASEEAAKSNPFVLDAFHDALAGRLYPELQKRGIVP